MTTVNGLIGSLHIEMRASKLYSGLNISNSKLPILALPKINGHNEPIHRGH